MTSRVGWVEAFGTQMQVPVFFESSVGINCEIGVGGFLRPVNRIESGRVVEVLGWIDTRDADSIIAIADAMVITEHGAPREEAAS